MNITEKDKNAVLGLLQGSTNPEDKALATDVLSAISKAMNGDQSAESDIRSVMSRINTNSMLYTICARMVG